MALGTGLIVWVNLNERPDGVVEGRVVIWRDYIGPLCGLDCDRERYPDVVALAVLERSGQSNGDCLKRG